MTAIMIPFAHVTKAIHIALETMVSHVREDATIDC